jgi:DNA-binding transcriptional regulator YdaS (Cro superfamily)
MKTKAKRTAQQIRLDNLVEWCGGTEWAAARVIGVSQSTINRWRNLVMPVTAEKAVRIQQATGGVFKAEDFCPALRVVTRSAA